MNGKNLHDAVAFVGHDLIDMAEKQTFRRSSWQTALASAACAALILGLGTALHRQPATEKPAPAEQYDYLLLQEPPHETEAEQPTEEAAPILPADVLCRMFPMLDYASAAQFLHTNPELDVETLSCNEAGLNDPGLDLYSVHGDQVLAIDVPNEILLIRVQGSEYRGVLAIANDPAVLTHQASSQLGITGEYIGTIAEAHNGVLAINSSGFLDLDGTANGGQLFGYAMCDGTSYNDDAHLSSEFRRLEIDNAGLFRLAGIQEPIADNVQHAVEFGPALIKNGEILVDETCGYTGSHPRTAIGQSETGAVMMLVIEGRMQDYSVGTNAIECAEILLRYGCQTAINLDGGTSSILWYDGEYVTRCSNQALPEGRYQPTAFVYARKN